MPITTKDSLPEVGPGTAQNDAQPVQPANAVSAEISVTVHASRYSSPAKTAGKLPPVHEETRTVIIFPQGAIVRLSATVTQGELVVLTNNRTGTDVICRVTNVKTQPGIQNYVHLEFTQRALDFWQDLAAPDSGLPAKKSVALTPASNAPSATPPPTPNYAAPKPPAQQVVQPVARAPLPAPESNSAPASPPKITPLADVPVSESSPARVKSEVVQPRLLEPASAAVSAEKALPERPARAPQFQPFEPQPRRSTSKKVVLFAIAAVVLLTIGAVAGALLLRDDHGASLLAHLPNSGVTSSPSPIPAAPEAQLPVINPLSPAPILEPAAAIPARDSLEEKAPPEPPVRAAAEPAKPVKPEVQPPAVSRSVLNVGKISAPKPRMPAQVNAMQPPSVFSPEPNLVPSAIADSGPAALPRVTPVAVAQPVPPAPVKGGQLQQPRLVSSVAAVYPPLARAQRVQGDVTIDALIDATGKVAQTKVLTGNALLQKAATDSLQLWKYKPALLDGEPIPVHIKVTVTFHLN